MSNRLDNILVPVDFTTKNKWAIVKAIEFANSFDCTIHLVYVLQKNILPFVPIDKTIFTPYESYAERKDNFEKLQELKGYYSNQLCGRGSIEVSVLAGNARRELADYIRLFNMDLVITGLTKFSLFQPKPASLSISWFARRTHIPVLAVRAEGLACHFKKIILALHDMVSFDSIKLAVLLARKFRSTVYIIALQKPGHAAERMINEGLEMVRSISNAPVQGIILDGENLAKSTLNFAKHINADLIMINPLKEFNLPGWWNRLFSKLLSYGSKIPVITVGRKHMHKAELRLYT